MSEDPIVEAAAIFSRSHHVRDPRNPLYADPKKAAAKKLLAEVIAAVKASGCYQVDDRSSVKTIVHDHKGTVWLKAHEDYIAAWSVDAKTGREKGIELPIEYDAATKSFVGTALDDRHHPVPGELKLKRRSGVVAVVEAICASIDEQAEQNGSAAYLRGMAR